MSSGFSRSAVGCRIDLEVTQSAEEDDSLGCYIFQSKFDQINSNPKKIKIKIGLCLERCSIFHQSRALLCLVECIWILAASAKPDISQHLRSSHWNETYASCWFYTLWIFEEKEQYHTDLKKKKKKVCLAAGIKDVDFKSEAFISERHVPLNSRKEKGIWNMTLITENMLYLEALVCSLIVIDLTSIALDTAWCVTDHSIYIS